MSGSDLQPANPCDEAERDGERRILASAWKGAGEVLDYMLGLFDPPAAIARCATVGPNTRQVMRDWLRNLEILVRRLLFITALGLILPPPRSGGKRRAVPATGSFSADDPSCWKVSLRFFRQRSEVRKRKARSDAPIAAPAEWNAIPFALRLEALRRIIAQPERRARSVARRLARIQAANVGRNAPRSFAIRHWHIHSSVRTPAQDFIADLMDGTESLAERWLVHWQEPG